LVAFVVLGLLALVLVLGLLVLVLVLGLLVLVLVLVLVLGLLVLVLVLVVGRSLARPNAVGWICAVYCVLDNSNM
jgi:hypothetical protein